ncbi:MAG: family 20 glycosylhydrolase [Bacteroidales bacterium]|nr:family 20 glycosylhydrolase [Bacteroidales bacterium]
MSAFLISIAGCRHEEPAECPDCHRYRIIPQPVTIAYSHWQIDISGGLYVATNMRAFDFEQQWLTEQLQSLKIHDTAKAAVPVSLSLTASSTNRESYELEISRKGIHISGPTQAGVFFGIQTLLQILEQAADSAATKLTCMTVKDFPRFGYRGMLLDVSRHFFGVEFVRKYIDLLAMHKMNTFHWHLTDDQGWRLEIRKYPQLTDVGAWRADYENLAWTERPFAYPGASGRYGGFYTQAQVRDIVAYAAERGITVIPEIEMPGHSAATLAAYPFLACHPAPRPTPSGARMDASILCAGKDSTLQFCKDVLTEVMELFPSRYIHIGGDEAPRHEWSSCPHCRARMDSLEMNDESELQRWFTAQIADFLSNNGRQLTGWDEIIEGGLPTDAVVMSWHDDEGGIDAARQGHDVIMSSTDYCYFDYPFSVTGIEKVYLYDPVPPSVPDSIAAHILGAQGNVWTEYITDASTVEYMILPRMTALCEVLWSPREARNYADFTARLEPFLKRCEQRGYSFCVPQPDALDNIIYFIDSIRVELSNPWPFAQIRYTCDGSEPDLRSSLYEQKFFIKEECTLNAAVFFGDYRSAVRTLQYRFAVPVSAYRVDSARLAPGLTCRYYEVKLAAAGEIKKYKPLRTYIQPQIGLPESQPDEGFAIELSGYIHVPAGAVYSVRMTSDDGSLFYLGENLALAHDGLHGASAVYGQIALERGYYPIYIGYFDAGGDAALSLQFHTGDGRWHDIPAEYLWHKPERY